MEVAGHTVRLTSPNYVKPFLKWHKDICPLHQQVDVLFALDFFDQNIRYGENVA